MDAPIRTTDLTELAALEADLFAAVDKAGFTEAQKFNLNKLIQTLSYNSATKELTLSDGNAITLNSLQLAINQIAGLYIQYLTNSTFLILPGAAKDTNWTYDMQLSSAFVKSTAGFSVGTNGGSLDSGIIEKNRTYWVYILGDSTGTNPTDIAISTVGTGFNSIPAGYDIYQCIGTFKTYPYSTDIAENSFINWIEYYSVPKSSEVYALSGMPIAYNNIRIDYFNYSLDLLSLGYLTVKNIFARDITDTFNLMLLSDGTDVYTKTQNLWSAGDGNGYLGEALIVSTNYYVFLIGNANAEKFDLFVTKNEIPSLPTGYNYYRAVGFGRTDSNGNLYLWKVGQYFEDENFDVATNLTSTVGKHPDIIAFNGTLVEIAAFDGASTVEEVSVGKESKHAAVRAAPLLEFHGHAYFTTAAAGNCKFLIDYYIDDGSGVISSTTTINAIIASPLLAWKKVDFSFGIFIDERLKAGTQIGYRLYRDPTDVQDTYGADVALRTFGYHILVEKEGSELLTSRYPAA
jgi:hypothetical protein